MKRIGDRPRISDKAHRRPQLTPHLGDEQRTGQRGARVQGGQPAQCDVVIWIGEADGEGEALIQGRGAPAGARGTPFDATV
jgi:hypothetical protein